MRWSGRWCMTEIGRIYAQRASDFLDAVDRYNERRNAYTTHKLERAAIEAALAYADKVKERGW